MLSVKHILTLRKNVDLVEVMLLKFTLRSIHSCIQESIMLRHCEMGGRPQSKNNLTSMILCKHDQFVSETRNDTTSGVHVTGRPLSARS